MFKSLSRCNVYNAQQIFCQTANKTPWILSESHKFCTEFGSIRLNLESKSKYNSKVGIMSHRSCLLHEISDHPESPERLKAVLDCLNNPQINGDDEDFSVNLEFFDNPTQITRSRITMAHSQTHVDDILDKAEDASEHNKVIQLDPDTFISPHSSQSIMCAPAVVSHAVEIVLNQKDDAYKVIIYFF